MVTVSFSVYQDATSVFSPLTRLTMMRRIDSGSLHVNAMSVLPRRHVGIILNASIMNSVRLLTLSEGDTCIQRVLLMHELECRQALNF